MDESDFDGTLVLEQLAEVGRVEDFFDAIDSDDIERASALMKEARVDPSTIALVVRKIEDADGDH
jgi:iron uptake system EfeUOB component EfeO/EfeM